MLTVEEIAALQEYVDHSFRDQADHDYICARSAWRLDCRDQALWLGLQALEKYLKAILLYRLRDTKPIGHNLTEGLSRVMEIPDVRWDFDGTLTRFLDRLSWIGRDRYFSVPKLIEAEDLHHLDHAVWLVRRYCFDMRVLQHPAWRGSDEKLQKYLAHLASADCKQHPTRFRLYTPGHLERVLRTTRFPSQRIQLIWRNVHFGARPKRRSMLGQTSWKSPAHFLYPALLPIIRNIVKLDKVVVAHLESELRKEESRQ